MKYLEIPFTQEGEYNEMQKQWESIDGIKSTFSMFESVDDEDVRKSWTVRYPNILDKSPIIEGKWFIEVGDWEHRRTLRKINKITWEDIADMMNLNDGHHVFLEGISIDEETKTLTILTGS